VGHFSASLRECTGGRANASFFDIRKLMNN
jgi:hypothetical protein